MLVKSLKNNDALHTVLLGGNPGFTVELAQSISRITSKSPLRLRYMPKGVAILLERWIKLQLTERTGGVILQDLSVTVIDRRFLGIAQNHGNNSQHEIDILDIHRSHTGDVIDFQNIDHDVKNIFMVEECSAKIWEPSVATAVGIGKEIGVKPDTSIIDNNIKTQHSIEWGTIKALDTEIPEDNFLSERSWYEEGSDVLNRCSEEQEPYLDNILHLEDESSLPHNDSPKGLTGSPVEYSSSSFGIALNNQEKETKRNRSNPPASAAASSHVSVQAPNQEGNKNIGSAYATSDEPYKRNSPVFFREDVQEKDNKGLRFGNYAEEDDWIGGGIEGGGGDGAVSGVGGRVEGWTGTGDRSKDRFLTSKVHNYFNKAIRSNSTERKRNHSKEVESPSPRHLADSGNFNFNISRNSRGGYSRDKGTTGATGSPINGMGQTPQSITPQSVLHSSDRGQGQGIGVEQRRGQGRGRRQGKEHGQGQGQGEYKKQSSPIFLIRSIHSHSESTIRYPLHRHQHIDDAHDSSDHGSPNYRHTEEDRMTSSATRKNKKTSKNSNTKKSKKRNQDLIIPNRSALSIIRHTALEHAMSCFSDSVKEVTESLGTVCEQLRDVTSSLSESLSELNKSHIRSPLSSALPTHNTHNSPSIIPGLGPVLIPIPLAVAGLGNKLAGVLDFDAKKSNNLIPLGETFGRSRGSLMHRDDEIKNEVKNEFKRDESSRNDVSHRGYYEGVPDVGTVKRSTLQKVHALLEERESTDRGSNTSSTLTSSANPQKTLSRTKSSRSSTLTTTERDREKEKDGIEDDVKNDLSIDNESEIEIIRDSIRNTESVASQNQNQNSNRVHSPLRDSSTSEDTSFNYSKFSRPKLGPKNKNPSQNSDLMPGGDHITQADMVAFIKERLHRKLHAVLRPL